MPGQQWLLEQLAGRRLAVRGNNWLVLHEATRAGAGLAVLPCYLGDPDPALKRVGGALLKSSPTSGFSYIATRARCHGYAPSWTP